MPLMPVMVVVQPPVAVSPLALTQMAVNSEHSLQYGRTDENGDEGVNPKPSLHMPASGDREAVLPEPGGAVGRRVLYSTGSPSPSKGTLTSKPPSSPGAHRLRAFGHALLHWVREYFLEWQLTDARTEEQSRARVSALTEAIAYSDVVLFVKPGGLCPFCNLAQRVFVEAIADESLPDFSLHVADLLAPEREALSAMLGLPLVTYPCVFIRGSMLPGGGEAVAELGKKPGGLAAALSAPPAKFEPLAVAPRTHRWPPLFLQQAGGGRWLTWQSTIYGNVLRVIALLQICVLVPANELWNRGHTAAATPLLVLLAADALLFTLTGPTPLTPLGNVATFIVWKRRGSVAPLGPYKASRTLQ